MSGKTGRSGRRAVATKKKQVGLTLSPDVDAELDRRAAATPSNSRSALVEKVLRREFGMLEAV